jgi:hypothetical protein
MMLEWHFVILLNHFYRCMYIASLSFNLTFIIMYTIYWNIYTSTHTHTHTYQNVHADETSYLYKRPNAIIIQLFKRTQEILKLSFSLRYVLIHVADYSIAWCMYYRNVALHAHRQTLNSGFKFIEINVARRSHHWGYWRITKTVFSAAMAIEFSNLKLPTENRAD